MSKRSAWGAVAAMAAFLLVAAAAAAGTEVVIESRPSGGDAPAERSTLFTDGSRVRLDLAGGRRTLLHLGQGRVIAIDHRKRSYVAIDRSQVAGVASSVGQVAGELRSRARSLPEGQRQVAEELLDGAFGPAPDAGPPVVLRDLPGREVVSGVPCRDREVLRGEQKLAVLCEARTADAGPAAAAMGPLRELAALAREVAPLLPGSIREQGLAAIDLMDRVEGVPMRVRTFRDGKPDRDVRVVEAKQLDLDPALFELPPGYAPEINITVRDHVGGP